MSTHRAKELRANSTAPERRMWRLLHPIRAAGYHFRRQEQIGPYYLDFACHSARLIIEIDGETHRFGDEADALRDEFLRHEAYRVLRLTNDDVLTNPDGVFAAVSSALEGSVPTRSRRPRPGLPHEGGGEEAASPSSLSTSRAL
ncbi:endonuclease domain-containing protein [Devosia sp. CN2-171]|uniref:endonuclease domain-containing protein n=1 Tax=Devosia sp. CN2-171 TaxID=3400909 RepID=UPI003BF863A6